MKILLLLLLSHLASANCGNKSNDFCQVKPTRVYDGDTFYVDIAKLHTLFGKGLGIRVKGVDTPELRGGSAYEKAMAQKAKAFTTEAIMNAKRIDLTDCTRGKYFRIVCHVVYDGKSLTEELINNKLAVPYAE